MESNAGRGQCKGFGIASRARVGGRKSQKVLERDRTFAYRREQSTEFWIGNNVSTTETGNARRRLDLNANNRMNCGRWISKGEYRLDDQSECFPFTILDDHSRYLVGLHALPSTRAIGVEERLIDTFRRYGVPDQMLMDHGTPWWNVANDPGLTKIAVIMMKQGIRLSYSGIGHPQTQGKVERLHRTLKAALRQKAFRGCYRTGNHDWMNFDRPTTTSGRTEALGMQVPATRYQASLRTYAERPTDWIYPAGYELVRTGSPGKLWISGKTMVRLQSAGE